MPLLMAMLPTWNEADNIAPLLDALLALNNRNGGAGETEPLPENCRIEALVVDDNSPDGTWKVVRERAAQDPRVHLLHRMRDKGRGLAGIAGFREALRLGADYVIEMDADWSHDPKWIPSLARRAIEPPGADLVIGSRLVPGGGEAGRHGIRKVITLTANLYIRKILRLPVRDATSGYRLFSRAALEAVPWNKMQARGPEVVQEVLLAIHSRGFRLAEVPILFVERRAGKSSFNLKIMAHSLGAMLRLRFFPGPLTPAAAEGLPLGLPRWLLGPASWLYRLGRWADRTAHLIGLRRCRTLPVPVVCVGNVTVGGTGKTPFVIFITRLLIELGRRPVVLSRGYGAEFKPTKPLLVADEHRRLARPEQAGDEPCLIAQELAGTPVVVFGDRYAAGQYALSLFSIDACVLDDGFQHDALARRIDLVLWDARDEPRQQRLLPLGRLREGVGALRRAAAIVLTHAEYIPAVAREQHTARVHTQIGEIAPAVPIFEARTAVSGWRRLSGRHGDATAAKPGGELPWAGKRVLLLAGLARPFGFATLIEATGAEIIERFFYPDHYSYSTDELDLWLRMMERTGAEYLLTTEKDAIKLAALPLGGLHLLAVQIAMQVEPPDTFRNWLAARLEIAAGAAPE